MARATFSSCSNCVRVCVHVRYCAIPNPVRAKFNQFWFSLRLLGPSCVWRKIDRPAANLPHLLLSSSFFFGATFSNSLPANPAGGGREEESGLVAIKIKVAPFASSIARRRRRHCRRRRRRRRSEPKPALNQPNPNQKSKTQNPSGGSMFVPKGALVWKRVM